MKLQTVSWVISICILIIIGAALFFSFRSVSQSEIATFTPQEKEVYAIDGTNDTPLHILATKLPEFAIKLVDQKFSDLWQAHAAERADVVDAVVTNTSHDTSLVVDKQFDEKDKRLMVTPKVANQMKPGLYHLNVKIKTVTGEETTITQDFTWGVLAINTSKATYRPGETAKIGMGVLDDLGHTKCIADGPVVFNTAKVWLKIISPSGRETHLSTDDKTIIGSGQCAAVSVTNNPDFQTTYKVDEVGKYTMEMTGENINGKRSITDYFMSTKAPLPFDVMRTSYPTRIYPYGHYPVEITVVANKDYIGEVSDFVPKNFLISNISHDGSSSEQGENLKISWYATMSKGQTYIFTYDVKFPLISPEFYLVGPLVIGSFKEGRNWQIASDAIALAQTPQSNVSTGSTTVSTTLTSTLTTGNLIIVVCGGTASETISSQARSGGNSWSTTSQTSTPRQRTSWRYARSTDSTTLTCTYSGSSGTHGIQVFEYSGLTTTGTIQDKTLSRSGISCTSGTMTTNSITITNPIELVFVAGVSTTLRNVNSHSVGYTAELSFNGPSVGTFFTADQVTSSIAAYSDTITFSGNAGTCSTVIKSFITPINISQNGYRFFENTDNAIPGTPIDLANTDITLSTPNRAFRIRLLVDVDGTQTQGLGTADYILEYGEPPISGLCSDLLDTDWNPIDATTPIAYNDNPSVANQANIATSGNDPTDAGYSSFYENYYDVFSADGTDDVSNNQNALSGNQAGVWDFSLIDNTDGSTSRTFCLRLTNGDGTGAVADPFATYVRYPKVTTFYNEVNIKSGTTINGGTTIN